MKKFICFSVVLVLCVLGGFVGKASAAPRLSSGSSTDTCWAAGDINGDGIVMTIGDLVEAIRILTCGAPFPESTLYQIDFNADCRVDTADLRIYENWWIYGPTILPRPFPIPTCCHPSVSIFLRGDVNTDGELSTVDAVLMLGCIFSGTGGCSPYYADLNFDSMFTSADGVLELNRVFLGAPIPGCP